MAASAWQKLWPPGRGLVNIDHLNRIFTGAASIAGLAISGALTVVGGITTSGAVKSTISVIAAAGASLGTATAMPATAGVVRVTVTASTEGVKLPTASTGREVTVIPSATVGVKVYGAAAGQLIGTATTATTAYALVKNTITTFFATSATQWIAQKGG